MLPLAEVVKHPDALFLPHCIRFHVQHSIPLAAYSDKLVARF